jgi:S-adenosyl methyltransferase
MEQHVTGQEAVAGRVKIDACLPSAARIYDYFLGGKDNFEIDRQAAAAALRIWPTARVGARENRAFLGRVVHFLVEEAGVRQFLDIGAGLPSVYNVHEVAQAVSPDCRVVYVDNDPMVLAQARALLASSPEGRTAYIRADLRQPEKLLADPAVRETLDFSQPIALMLIAVLHFIPDSDDPAGIIRTLLAALPAGSYLAASHVTPEFAPDMLEATSRIYRSGGMTGKLRDSQELAEMAFRGLVMADPGLVLVSQWRPPPGVPLPRPAEVNCIGGVGRKP